MASSCPSSQGTPLRPGHPHFTGEVRLSTEVLLSAERQGFQPQGASMELSSGEPISHCELCGVGRDFGQF